MPLWAANYLAKINFLATWHVASLQAASTCLAIAFAFVAAYVLVHEYAHKVTFVHFGYPARIILLPWRYARFRLERGRAIWLSLGLCHVEDRYCTRMVAAEVRRIAISGPLAELIFFTVAMSCLWPIAVHFNLYCLQLVILLFSPLYPITTMANWIPIRAIKNDGWQMWFPSQVIESIAAA